MLKNVTSQVLMLLFVVLLQAGDQAAAGSLHEILNPLDELQYWADIAGNPAMGEQAGCRMRPCCYMLLCCLLACSNCRNSLPCGL
jgi:hypothetical protein